MNKVEIKAEGEKGLQERARWSRGRGGGEGEVEERERGGGSVGISEARGEEIVSEGGLEGRGGKERKREGGIR